MSNGISQKCRLFLEGREVPFISATLVCNAGEPITAIIDMVPLQEIKFIRPKTQVHVFVKDTFNFGNSDFHLAFEGEVVGRQMGKSHDSRVFRITAIDYSGYWDEAKAFFYNHNFQLGKLNAAVSGAPSIPDQIKSGAQKTVTGTSTLNSQMITQILNKKNKDLLEGIVSVFKNISTVNLFYSAAWDRLRINDRVRMFSSGKLSTFMQAIQTEEFLSSHMGAMGGSISLREMMLGLMGLVFHDFISVPFPSRVAAYDGGATSGIKLGETIGSFLFVPDGYSLPAPRCNVIFPNQLQSLDFSEDFRAAPSRLAFAAEHPTVIKESLTTLAGPEYNITTYPMQYFPTGLADYMHHTNLETAEEQTSLLGTSSLLTDPAGNTYLDIFYGDSKTKAVAGTSLSPTLREADYLTNDESIRGIFLAKESLVPGMSALTRNVTAAKRQAFTQEVGKYLFYKKRFGSRNATATLLFHPFLVPGFNCLIIDDGDSGQTITAKVQSITHNLTHQGCSTSVQLGYARDFDEVDALTGRTGEPPLPAWFDKTLFGVVAKDSQDTAIAKSAKTAYDNETAYLKKNAAITAKEVAARNAITDGVCYTKVCDFFKYLLGCDAVTNVNGYDSVGGGVEKKLCTTRGAAYYLTQKYRVTSHKGPAARDAFVSSYIRRRPLQQGKQELYF